MFKIILICDKKGYKLIPAHLKQSTINMHTWGFQAEKGQRLGYNFPTEIGYPYCFFKINPVLFEILKYIFNL